MAEMKPTVSFGFSKKVETKRLTKSAVDEGTIDTKVETDFVLSLEGNKVNSSVPQLKENDVFVIPLIKKNRWRKGAEKRFADVKRESDSDDLDQQAVREVLEESAKYNESWEDGDKPDPNLAIPLLMQNKIPEGFETDDKLDVSLRPDEPDEADFEQIPIEQFGFAMLRGMGWKEGQGIGKNNKLIAPVEAHLRPKGLGLGADRSQGSDHKARKKDKEDVFDETENLVMKKGSFCAILTGKYKDLYGVVEGIDEDNARLVIKLTLSGQNVTLTQHSVKIVSRKDYEKYSKYLNKGETEKYKLDMTQNGHDQSNSDDKKDRSIDGSYHDKKNRKMVEDNSRKRKHDSKDKSHSKHQRSSDDKLEESATKTKDSKMSGWLQPYLRVRIIDRHYKNGKYYKQKVVVIDVISHDSAICKTDDGKILEGLTHSQLETVIPKNVEAYVMLCSGQYRGQLGKIVKKEKDLCKALVQLLTNRNIVLKVEYDDVCEYVGSIEDEFDY